MTFGIFSLESGDALEWYPTQEDALRAAARIIYSEPESAGAVGVMAFDDDGAPTDELSGNHLLEVVRETFPYPGAVLGGQGAPHAAA